MTRTSRFDFSSGPDPDPACWWDTKREPFSLAEVCAPLSVVLVSLIFVYLSKKGKSSVQEKQGLQGSDLHTKNNAMNGVQAFTYHTIDFERMFDSVNREAMRKILRL